MILTGRNKATGHFISFTSTQLPHADDKLDQVSTFSCGPYMVYLVHEVQTHVSGKAADEDPFDSIVKAHFYVVYQTPVLTA